MFIVYQLRLEGGKHYFGSTPFYRKQRRLDEHRDGGGAKWTARYPPLEPDPVVQTWHFATRKEAETFENEKTEEFLNRFGIDSTRGGLQNYGSEGGYRWWVRKHLRHLVPVDYDYNS